MYQSYTVYGQNGHVVHHIQARTNSEAKREYREMTGRTPMKAEQE